MEQPPKYGATHIHVHTCRLLLYTVTLPRPLKRLLKKWQSTYPLHHMRKVGNAPQRNQERGLSGALNPDHLDRFAGWNFTDDQRMQLELLRALEKKQSTGCCW